MWSECIQIYLRLRLTLDGIMSDQKCSGSFPHLIAVLLFDIFVWIILVIEMLIMMNA